MTKTDQTHEARQGAIRNAMILVRSMGPVTESQIKREIWVQTGSVTKKNIDEIHAWTMGFLLKHKSIEVYDCDEAEKSYVIGPKGKA